MNLTTKMLALAFSFVAMSVAARGQGFPIEGDFRSRQSGNWNDPMTWERYSETTAAWIWPAPHVPSFADRRVQIAIYITGEEIDTVRVTSGVEVEIDELTVQGVLEILPGGVVIVVRRPEDEFDIRGIGKVIVMCGGAFTPKGNGDWESLEVIGCPSGTTRSSLLTAALNNFGEMKVATFKYGYGGSGAAGAINNFGEITVTGSFDYAGLGAVTGNPFRYGTNSTLVLNLPAGSAIDSANVFWPSSNSPSKVHVSGAGGLTLNASRTVNEFYTYTTVHGSRHLTVNKQLVLWFGSSIHGAPTYSPGSTLLYAGGSDYARGDEWSATSGAGYPANVFIRDKTILNYPNGSTASRGISGDLIIIEGSALRMDYGNLGVNHPLTVGGRISGGGALHLGDAPGGDLHLRGDWDLTNLTPNARAVIFDGAAQQHINTTTTFDHLTLNNPAGVRLTRPATVNQTLSFSAGNLILASRLTHAGAVQGASRARHLVTLAFGDVAHAVAMAENFQFPIGATDSTYNPITIALDAFPGPVVFTVQAANSFAVSPPSLEKALHRQWNINSSAGGVRVTLTLQWEPEDAAGPQFNPAAGVALGWYDAALGQWLETPAIYDPGPPRRATATFSRFSGIFPVMFGLGNLGAFTSVTEHAEAPTEFALYQNYPNPFNPATSIDYALPVAAEVSLAIYNNAGQKVAQLVKGRMRAGRHQISFEAAGLASGVYVCRLQAGAFVKSMKLVLFK